MNIFTVLVFTGMAAAAVMSLLINSLLGRLKSNYPNQYEKLTYIGYLPLQSGVRVSGFRLTSYIFKRKYKKLNDNTLSIYGDGALTMALIFFVIYISALVVFFRT